MPRGAARVGEGPGHGLGQLGSAGPRIAALSLWRGRLKQGGGGEEHPALHGPAPLPAGRAQWPESAHARQGTGREARACLRLFAYRLLPPGKEAACRPNATQQALV